MDNDGVELADFGAHPAPYAQFLVDDVWLAPFPRNGIAGAIAPTQRAACTQIGYDLECDQGLTLAGRAALFLNMRQILILKVHKGGHNR